MRAGIIAGHDAMPSVNNQAQARDRSRAIVDT
jgi:hypothetical protein